MFKCTSLSLVLWVCINCIDIINANTGTGMGMSIGMGLSTTLVRIIECIHRNVNWNVKTCTYFSFYIYIVIWIAWW